MLREQMEGSWQPKPRCVSIDEVGRRNHEETRRGLEIETQELQQETERVQEVANNSAANYQLGKIAETWESYKTNCREQRSA